MTTRKEIGCIFIISCIVYVYRMKSLFREKKWADLQTLKEDGELKEFIFESNLGKVCYRFFKREAGIVDGVQYYDIASYRGAQGPYVEEVRDKNVKKLLVSFRNAFANYCSDNKIVAEFAKLDPWDENADITREVLEAECYGNFYGNNLKRDFYNIDYNRRAKRAIKKALNMGVTVQVDYMGKTIPEFLRLYQNTETKYHTSNYYNFSEEDIKQYFSLLEGRCFLINAVVEGEIITAVLVAYGEDIMHYLYLGNNPDFLDYQANSLLTYRTALIGQELGLDFFDMGGGIPGGNIEVFKRNFISDDGVCEYFAVKKIWNTEIYQSLLNKKTEIKNHKMFPLYRG